MTPDQFKQLMDVLEPLATDVLRFLALLLILSMLQLAVLVGIWAKERP